MKFWKLSTQTLAALLASVSIVLASGPSDGDAIADPDSAVVQLDTKGFKDFLDENPLILAEFFAPWCGYCKQLGPEFAKAADILNETNPNIKLAQIDCTKEEQLCQQHSIQGYPTLKVIRGAYQQPDDYDGPRDAEGIALYMIKQAQPPVLSVANIDDFVSAGLGERRPYVVQIVPEAAHKLYEAANATFGEIANKQRKATSFFSFTSDKLIKELAKLVNVDISGDEPKYLVVHPSELKQARLFEGEFSEEAFDDWLANAKVPYFGDINRETYMVYMGSKLPLGYYFYNTGEQRSKVEKFFHELGKKYVGVINFVGLDASLYGRHAEILNMDADKIPLFAIQDNLNSRKYGVDQNEHPDGPSTEVIEKFVESFLANELKPIIKSEPLPTEEEIAASEVVKLVAHNYDDVLADLSKDVLVEYYAPWCGHCKKLAPIWEELAGIYDSKNPESKVTIAAIDHSNNDVDTPLVIEGYPTIIFYPANGEIDPKSGLRKAIHYDKGRDLESFIEFVKAKGTHQVDGEALKAAKSAATEDAAVEEEEEEEEEVEEASVEDHDEL